MITGDLDGIAVGKWRLGAVLACIPPGVCSAIPYVRPATYLKTLAR